jgi:predicted acylesterase/phospholipase RssA
MIPYRIYLSGGGVCTVAHVGALKELSNHFPLKAIKEWMGVSAGALLAMCLAIGFSVDEMEEFSLNFDFNQICETDSVPGWILHWGMDTGERLHRLVEACLHVKDLSSGFTFEDCQKQFGISLRIVVTDINEGVARVYSPSDTPTYLVANAVRASMSFPYYFQPFICPETGHYLMDGGIISNYPLFVLPKEEHSRTLSILVQTSIKKVEDLSELPIEQLLTRPIQLITVEKATIEQKHYDADCISVRLEEINILDFGMKKEDRLEILEKGKEAVQQYKKQSRVKRRNSF